jgi:hypothetical protein
MMVIKLFLYLWPVTVFTGVLYLIGKRTDPVLYVVLCIGIGLTAAACTCIGLWLLFGGWGPPMPTLFGTMGVLMGVVAGILTFPHAGAASNRRD